MMLCVKCQKNPATMHIQQFMLNGVKSELHICQECAFGLDNPEILMSFENMFKGFLEQMSSKIFADGNVSFAPKTAIKCSRCGMTYDEFKAGGKLGCDTCYQAFEKEVKALLKGIQGTVRHEGKYPRRMGVEIMQKRHTEDLRAGLKKAIEDENFEEAAKLRDEIRALENADEHLEPEEISEGGLS